MTFKEFMKKSFIAEYNVSPDLLQKGQSIAKKLGVVFQGVWELTDLMQFTDVKDTESTFVATDEEEARKKLEAMRKKFADARMSLA
jgi:hypothetical protein